MEGETSQRRNFTNFEREILLQLTEKYISIIENKKTNATTIKEKQETWKTNLMQSQG